MGTQVSYASPELKNQCLDPVMAEQAYGRTHADRLATMIADAEAFENAREWHDFLGEDLVSAATKSFRVAFGTLYTASFEAIDNYQLVDGAGQVDWSTVQYIKLTEIAGQQ
ncbi:hypothetical protein [Rhizobium sp. BR 315]|uniref:hypothetical protein n=1 Tax=Rhizobium sp. BR 315 TaxID=3040014 RepID=UPI003D346880